MASTLLPDEEIIKASDLQRRYADVLGRAAEHPVSVHRDSGEDITLVARAAWQRAEASRAAQGYLADLLSSVVTKLVGEQAAFPPSMAWLEAFDNEDLAEFVRELLAAVRDASEGKRAWKAVATVLQQWERSADVATDRNLQARFATIRDGSEATGKA